MSFFVATLGHSRRVHVRAFVGERQWHWFEGMESAFAAFGGVPEEVLLDNARALILSHDPASREVVVTPALHAFARHWGFQVRACAPYRPRTKGKDERGVGYVRGAVAGRSFESFEALEAHLARWTRETACVRVHGTTGEAPAVRFARDEARALRPLPDRGPFLAARELSRRVGSDCAVELDTNAYSVPWRLIEPPRLFRRRFRLAFYAAMAAFTSWPWKRALASAGGTCPIGPRSRRWLNQSTHSRVASSTASRLRQGPRRRITSVLKRPITVSARALS